MRLNIEHRTRLAFGMPMDYTIQQLHLTPCDGFGQRVKRWEIRVNGKMQPHADTHGNLAHTLVVDSPHSAIDITATGEVETGLDIPPVADRLPLQVYLRSTPYTAMDTALTGFAEFFGKPGGGMDSIGLLALLRAVRNRITYRETPPDVLSPAPEAFAAGMGGSQDQAHVFIACCRHLGVPARYVSGYLFNVEQKAVANHAWADVWMDGAWLSFDITTGLRANGIHVRLATGLDGRDASPISQARHADASTTFRVLAHSMEQSQQ